MRTSSLAALLALVACGKQPDSPRNLQQTAPAVTQADPVEHIACARGTGRFVPDCTLEREATRAGEVWTIRHPDGGFRRLIVKGDEIETADGAELLRGAGREMTVGNEHYRLP